RRAGTDDIRKPAIERRDDAAGVVDAECRLREVGDRRFARQTESLYVLFVLHQEYRPGNLAERAFHFGMSGVTDQDDRTALAYVMSAMAVDFRDERARRVEHMESAALRLGFHRFRNAVRTEDRDCIGWNLGKILDEARPACFQGFHHPFVVHDLVA